MPIVIQPSFDVLPAYRPVKFELLQAFLNPEVVENAVVTILESGVPIGPPIRFKSSRNEPSALGPLFTDYYFEVDIQKYIQDYLGPFTGITSNFVVPGTLGAITNSELFGLFSISVMYEIIDDSTGLLVEIPQPPEVSNEFYVYAVARQSSSPFFEQMDLEDYVGTPLAQGTNFLTKSSTFIDICEEDNVYLSIIQPNSLQPVNGFAVVLFDANDSILSFGVGATLAPTGSAMFTMNVGIPTLSSQPYLDGAPNFSDPNLAYYRINFGYLTVLPGPTYIYTEQTDTAFQYNIKKSCCDLREFRLHWMNLLGGVDSYSFQSEKELVLKTTSDKAQKALPWTLGSVNPHSVNAVGKFKIKSEATPSFNVKSKFLTNEQAVWLSELLTSPKVYAEIESKFIPVIITDKEQTISRHTGKIRFEITAELANDWIIQRI